MIEFFVPGIGEILADTQGGNRDDVLGMVGKQIEVFLVVVLKFVMIRGPWLAAEAFYQWKGG